jgi:prophage regulatory protein
LISVSRYVASHRGTLGDRNVRLLSYDELKSRKGIGYSKAHLWRLEKEHKFPKRVPLGESRHGWIEDEIDNWILERAASRNEEAA